MATPEIIRLLMYKGKLTAYQLADTLEVPHNAIYYYINNKRKPSIKTGYRIIEFAKTLGMDVTLEELYPNE